ncbi:MAG: NAD-dependent epimerase/dehydratase family protein [Candidatus Woesebacteria bacterium]|nr:MAG: NAD-dependent epimerase/dehydratase family protein [Candidatus Woesebacteria bacterium]
MIKNKRILITGGAGFIGSTLVRKLAANNDIVVYDNLRRDAMKYFPKENGISDVNFVKGDILDANLLRGVTSFFKPQIVFHLAAMAGVTDYYRQPTKTMEVNAVGTYNVLQSVKDLPIERFIYFSTSEVYGPTVFGVKEDAPTAQGELKQMRWCYGISKLAGESLVFSYSQEFKLPLTSIRPFNIYGPGQVGEGAIQIFIRKALSNLPIEVTGNGNQIRAWCYIDDLVSATLTAAQEKKALGEIFNVGNPEGTVTILSLAKIIIRLSNSKSKISFVPHKGVDIDLRVPNVQKAEEILRYQPKVDLESGLLKSIAWYRDNNIKEPL